MLLKRNAALGFIFVTLLIDVIGLGIIIPVMPKLITELTGDTLGEAARDGGLLMFVYAFFQFICAPIVGGLSDQFGRRPVLLASLLGFTIDYLFLTFAPTLFWLYIGRIIAGILGASFTTAAAYIADVSTPEKRSQNFGLIGAAFGAGFIIGPVIGGLLGQYGSRTPFMVAAGLSFVNFLYGYFVLPESLQPENRRKFDIKRANPIGALMRLKRYPVIVGLVVSLVLMYLASYAIHGTWSYFVMEKFGWQEKEVGISLGVFGVLSMVVQGGLIRVIIPRLGNERCIYIGMTLLGIGFILFALAQTSWQLYLFMVPYILGGIAGPALQGVISTQVQVNEQGELQGALTSLNSATSIVGPPLMTTVFSTFTTSHSPLYLPGAPMILAAIFTIIGAILARRNMKSRNNPGD